MAPEPKEGLFDSSAFLGAWPFRDLPDTDAESLERRLRQEGITGALVSPLEALFHADPQPASRRVARRVADTAFFRFAPIVHPSLPGWEAAPDAWGGVAAALRLCPGYHGYSPLAATEMARAAGTLALPVVVQLRMQDVRSMHPFARVPDVDAREALALTRACPETRFLLAGVRWAEANRLREEAPENVFLEFSNLEYVDGLRRFLDRWGPERLLCGSHAPLFTPTALRLRIETARLTEDERSALAWKNARVLGLTR